MLNDLKGHRNISQTPSSVPFVITRLPSRWSIHYLTLILLEKERSNNTGRFHTLCR